MWSLHQQWKQLWNLIQKNMKIETNNSIQYTYVLQRILVGKDWEKWFSFRGHTFRTSIQSWPSSCRSGNIRWGLQSSHDTFLGSFQAILPTAVESHGSCLPTGRQRYACGDTSPTKQIWCFFVPLNYSICHSFRHLGKHKPSLTAVSSINWELGEDMQARHACFGPTVSTFKTSFTWLGFSIGIVLLETAQLLSFLSECFLIAHNDLPHSITGSHSKCHTSRYQF